ncbi:ribbon-helix-helix protein, CopG family [Luteolibacter arcticus]|uniref:Ribbon-helix-helix protein, CopG family n=1 Tax=Luteolibacter arcticus TaxID=1581411 RepID=A0ABT3GMY8_9BACT|nr:ribbon-helix-helix protein, CopG family [Luteolibacter arcticus]MCW1924884.1 ribbon-helix-helix protein, CopG family [Luteolibacter arcticus]
MAIITCKIPKELDEQLAAAAGIRRVSKSAIVRQALEAALAAKKPAAASLFEQMKDGLGCIDSGVSDLATNKKHLEGYGGKKVRRAP